MSQYFQWINFDKRQYLGDMMFSDGLKATESAYVGSPKTEAVTALLGTIWRGDLIAFTGEYYADVREVAVPGRDDGLIRIIKYPIDYYDVDYEFEDVGGRLSCARGKLGVAVVEDGEYGLSLAERPYEGPFDIEVEHFRYIINETKREYFDREQTSCQWVRSNTDLLPLLLGTSWGHLAIEGKTSREPDGRWVGDLVYPSHKEPKGFANVSRVYSIAK